MKFPEPDDSDTRGKLKGDRSSIWKSVATERNLEPDDQWFQFAGTGGDWGDPLKWDPASVLDGANRDQVPPEFFKSVYGVVLNRNGISHAGDQSAINAR